MTPERPTPADIPGAPRPTPRSAPPPVTHQPRTTRPPTGDRASSGLTPEQTIRHVALTHATHYYRDTDALPTPDDVLKTAAQFAAWIKDGNQ